MNKKINLYFLTTFLIITINLVFFLITSKNIILGDGMEYYSYFTRTFINQDLGSATIKYPMGTTLLQLPFLLFSLFFSMIFNIDVEYGYSMLFNKTILFASGFYCVLGLIILYKIVKDKFSPLIASLTCLSLFYGTMLYFDTSTYLASYSHIYGFFTCCLFVYYVIYYEKNYYNSDKKRKIVFDTFLALSLALACLIRYTNIIMVFAYIFYNVFNKSDFLNRIKILFSKKTLYQISILLFVFLIQIFVYKIFSGDFVLHGYKNESFIYLLNPQVYKVLFSASKGLFVYCPLLFMAFLSMFFVEKKNEFSISQPLIFILLTYIVSSWWCWWLGYGYSGRMYCDILCVFALPLASLINLIFVSRKKILSLFLCVCIACFIALNLVWIKGVATAQISPNLATSVELREYLVKCLKR